MQIQRTEQNRVDSRVDRIVILRHLHLLRLRTELFDALLRFLAEPIEPHLEVVEPHVELVELPSCFSALLFNNLLQ